MTSLRLHQTDCQRSQAIALRRLLMRIEAGEDDDRELGADILYALGAPAPIGDPTDCIDCAGDLAEFLHQPRIDVLSQAVRALADRIRGGWKSAADVSGADTARAMTIILLRVRIAHLERAPI